MDTIAAADGNPRLRAYTLIKSRQIYWALKRGIQLQGSEGTKGEEAYTARLQDNLFCPLSSESMEEYNQGKGGELKGNKAGVCKMQALHSSAALATNVFDYWRDKRDKGFLLRSLGLRFSEASIVFEHKLAIMDKPDRRVFRVDPHLDVFLKDGGNIVGIESKFSESYGGYKHAGLKQAYLDRNELWKGIPACREFAETLCPLDLSFEYLHPAQLLKHILGLINMATKGGTFELIYLWYDVPFNAGYEHRAEVERFGEIIRKDGIRFNALTYQELILGLADHRNEHREYVDYLTERYL